MAPAPAPTAPPIRAPAKGAPASAAHQAEASADAGAAQRPITRRLAARAERQHGQDQQNGKRPRHRPHPPRMHDQGYAALCDALRLNGANFGESA
jgi:hypothetical protein